MKNYKQIEKGVYESVRSQPQRPIDETRIREIVRDKSPHLDRHVSDSREDRNSGMIRQRKD